MKRLFVLFFPILFCFSAVPSFAGNVYEIISKKDWEVKETQHVASLKGGLKVFGWMEGEKAVIKGGEGKVNILKLEKAILSSPLLINGREIVPQGATLVNNAVDTDELGTIEVYFRARKKTVMVFLTKSQIEKLAALVPQAKSAE